MHRSRIALLVPCRNGAGFLRRLAESARNQTRAFDEFIVFDDGSTDDTAEVARSMGAEVIGSPVSLGPSAARNRLASAAKSEWLHFHDADDVMAPGYADAVMKAAQDPATLVICDMRWVDELDGREVGIWRYNEAEIAQAPIAYFLRHTLGGINGLFRADRFRALGGFNENLRFWEDLDLALRWADAGEKIAVVPHELVTAFRRDGSLSRTDPIAVWQSKLALLQDRLARHGSLISAAVIAECEQIAERLLRLGDRRGADAALGIVREAGGDPPTTQHPLLKCLKRFLPRLWCLSLQMRLREQRSQSKLQAH